MDHNFGYDVFLSHNSKDKPTVRELAKRLRKAGLKVWFDEWVIQAGDDIYLALEQGFESSRTLILCISPAALGSEWVALERSSALFRDPINKHRRFVPVLLATCDVPDVLRRYKYIDWRRKDEAAFRQLVRACAAEQYDADTNADENLHESAPWWSSTINPTGVHIVFETRPQFPNLEFSIVNNGANSAQITSITIISAATTIYDVPGVARLISPVSNLSYTVQGIGNKTRIFGHDTVCNLAPGEIERFRLAIDCQFTAAVLDIDIELVTPLIGKSLVFTPDSIILVGCSSQEIESGQITLVSKEEILDIVAGTRKVPTHLRLDPTSLLIESASQLCRHALARGWNEWISHLSNQDSLAYVLHSFVKSGRQETPSFVLSYVANWISDIENINTQPAYSIVSSSLVGAVSSNLSQLGLNIGGEEYVLRHLDATLAHNLTRTILRHRVLVIENVCTRLDSIEYLISVMMAIPAHADPIHWLIYRLLKSSKSLRNKQCLPYISSDKDKYDFWKSWWSHHKNSSVYSRMQWREFSPRLIAMLGGEAVSATSIGDGRADG